MAKGAYIGVLNKAHKVKKGYIGVGGKARKIKKAYIGVGGKARLWWSGLEGKFIGISAVLHIYSINNADNVVTEGLATNFSMYYITWCKGRFFGISQDGKTLFYSSNLTTWSMITLNTTTYTRYLLGFCADANNVYVIESNSSGSSGSIALSQTNFRIINAQTLEATSKTMSSLVGSSAYSSYNYSERILSVTSDGEICIALWTKLSSSSSTYYMYFYNPSTDTARTCSTSSAPSWWILGVFGFSPTKYSAFDNNGYIGYWTKGSGTSIGTFTKSSVKSARRNPCVYGNGKFIAFLAASTFGSNPGIAYSTDLINWTYTLNGSAFKIGYGDGKFFAIDALNDDVYVSTDAITWTNVGNTKTKRTGGGQDEIVYDTTYGFGDK